MKNKIKILIGVLVVGIILVGGWWVWNNYYRVSETYREELNKEINDKIEKLDKSCQSNEDCKTVELLRLIQANGAYPICVNKGEVVKEIRSLQNLYYKRYKTSLPNISIRPVPFYGCECKNNVCIETTEKVQEVIITTDNNCKIKMPNGIKLQSFQRYDAEAEDSNYNLITIPRDLCIDSYPSSISGYYIVQYDGSITEEKKKQVQDLDVKSYGYVPDNLYIYKMNGLRKNKLESFSFIKWISIYQPAFKVSPSISKEMISHGDNLTINILFFDIDGDVISLQIQNLGGSVISTSEDKMMVQINSSKIPEIAKINDVVWIERWIMPTIQ